MDTYDELLKSVNEALDNAVDARAKANEAKNAPFGAPKFRGKA